VLAGAAFKNRASALLDAVVDYLPAPVAVRRSGPPAAHDATHALRQAADEEAVLRARVQDHDRSVRRKLDLFPGSISERARRRLLHL